MARPVAAALLALALVSSSVALQSQVTGIQRVAWLTGCWSMTDGGRTVEEHWMAPAGSAMIGSGRTVNSGKLVDYELVVLREDGDRLAYEAHPANQAPATFYSSRVTPTSVVFENPGHDFPQRVGYERRGDELAAYVEGETNGRTRRIEFPYRRVPCNER